MADPNADQLDFAAKQVRYWSYAPKPTHTVGCIATDYFTLWREAKGGEYSPYMAGMFLVLHMPTDWINWAWAILEEISVMNDNEEPTTNSPSFVLTILDHWMNDPNYPSPPPDPLAILEEPAAREPSSPIDIPVPHHEILDPPVYPPPNLPPIHVPRSPLVSPPAALWVRRAAQVPPIVTDIPFATIWEPTSRFEMGSSSALPLDPSASAANSPPRPVTPPTSPNGYRRTARIRTRYPPDSPFRFNPSDYDSNLSDYDSDEESESPFGPFYLEIGSGSLTYDSSESRGTWDTEKECTGHMKDLDWDT